MGGASLAKNAASTAFSKLILEHPQAKWGIFEFSIIPQTPPEIAKTLLASGMTPEFVSQSTGLSLQEVRKLIKK